MEDAQCYVGTSIGLTHAPIRFNSFCKMDASCTTTISDSGISCTYFQLFERFSTVFKQEIITIKRTGPSLVPSGTPAPFGSHRDSAPETAKTHKHEFNTSISNYIMLISIYLYHSNNVFMFFLVQISSSSFFSADFSLPYCM